MGEMKMQKRFPLLVAVLVGLSWGNASAPVAAQGPVAARENGQGSVRVIVGFRPGASAAARSAIAAAQGRVAVDLGEVDGLGVELPAAAIAALQRNPNIEFVENDPPRYAFGMASPMALPGTPQTAPYGIGMVQADQLPDTAAANRRLCIIDSGVDAGHEDLTGNVLDGENLTASGQWYTDENSHGTHVAGTVAAIDNAVGVVGVLPHAQINVYIAKVFDASGSAASTVIARAMLDCAAAGANVVSMSLGGSAASQIESRVTERLAANNVLVIAAAGNDGTTAVSYPAGFPDVVSVAAVDSTKTKASFSQSNDDVELAAPGVDVLSTVPIGSQIAATLAVGRKSYDAEPMEGSPLTSASGRLADFGLGDTPALGSMRGKVCLIQRGTISFADKVLNCQKSGGVGAIIYNNADGNVNGTLGTTVTSIPSVGTLQSTGQALQKRVGQMTTVSLFTTNDAYASYSGTSMATPHVSAVAALVWSYYPQCTAAQIRDTLGKSAEDLGDPGRDASYGFGLVQARAAFDRVAAFGCGN
jgi:subtilisin family serine protease